MTVTQATALTEPDNVATVLVTAENGRTQTYTVTFTVALDSAKAITGFSLTLTEPEAQVAEGIINEAAETIAVTVLHGTDLTSLTPTITHTGESISPASGEAQNFSTPVTYTVTAVDGSTAEYVVTVYVAPSTETALSVFEVGGQNVKDLAGVNTAEGATLTVSDFTGFKGITVQAAAPDVQSVTVTINDLVVPEAELAERAIAANDVLIVTVVAADGESTVQYKVTVVPVLVTGVSLNKTELFLQVGTTAEEPLIATIEPANATNKDVAWESSNPAIVTVDSDGLVTAEAVGTATITVTTVDGGLTVECTVTVVDTNPVIDESCILYLDGRLGSNDPATQTWYDLSGNGNDGTLNNFAFDETSGWTGQGLQFDGVDDYVDLGDINNQLANKSGLSFSFWMKRDTRNVNNAGIIGLGQDARQLWVYYRHDLNRIEFSNHNSNEEHNLLYISNVFKPDIWYHCAGTWDGATKRLFINGEEVASVAFTGQTHAGSSNNFIGFMNSYNYASGIIRDITIYNRALSSAEIAQNYLATKDPESLSPVDGTVLDLRGTEGTNDDPTTEWQDASGYGNHGTLRNVDFIAGDGWTGEALELDGVDSYVDCGDDASLNFTDAVTIDAWIKCRTVGSVGIQVIAGKGQETADAPGYRLLYNDVKDKFQFSFWNGVDQVATYTPELAGLQADTWYHVAATFNGAQIRYYLNGALFSVKDTGDTQIDSNNTSRFYVGTCVNTIQQFFAGSIGGVRVYPRALSDSEVLQNYLTDKDTLL